MYYEIYVENDIVWANDAKYGTKSLKRAKFIMSLLKEKYENKEDSINDILITLYKDGACRFDQFYAYKNKYEEIVKYLKSILEFEYCLEQSKNNFLDQSGFYKDIIPNKGSYALYKLIYSYALTLYENRHDYFAPKNEIPEYLQMPLKEREKYSKIHDELYKKASERKKNEEE